MKLPAPEAVATPRRRPNGMTLIQLVVALTIFTVGVLAFRGLMGSIGGIQRSATFRAELVSAAVSKLEDLRAFAAAGSADTILLAIGGSAADTVQDGVGRRYVRRWEVVAGPAGARQVAMRVHHMNTPRDSLTLRTIIWVE